MQVQRAATISLDVSVTVSSNAEDRIKSSSFETFCTMMSAELMPRLCSLKICGEVYSILQHLKGQADLLESLKIASGYNAYIPGTVFERGTPRLHHLALDVTKNGDFPWDTGCLSDGD